MWFFMLVQFEECICCTFATALLWLYDIHIKHIVIGHIVLPRFAMLLHAVAAATTTSLKLLLLHYYLETLGTVLA